MATRNYIQAAAPYATINSSCFVASVQKSRVGNKILIPVYVPPGKTVPTNQNDILRMIDGIAATEGVEKDEVHSDAWEMMSAKTEHASCIDGAIASYEYAIEEHNAEVPTVSF